MNTEDRAAFQEQMEAIGEAGNFERVELLLASITSVSRIDASGHVTTAVTRGVPALFYVDIIGEKTRECVWEGTDPDMAATMANHFAYLLGAELFDLTQAGRESVQ